MKGFYLPWFKNRVKNNQNIFKQYHQDFHLLTGKLLNYYALNQEVLVDWDKKGSITAIEEVTIEDVQKFVPN